jgi:hypothetical protein
MIDSSEFDLGTPQISATQSVNPQAPRQHCAVLPAGSRGSEYASFATLASAPSAPLLDAVQSWAGILGSSFRGKDNKAVIYQLGPVNLVVNSLPNSFSVSSAANGAAETR